LSDTVESWLRLLEEKICFLEEQAEELKSHQDKQAQVIFKLEKKTEQLQNLLKRTLARQAADGEDSLIH